MSLLLGTALNPTVQAEPLASHGPVPDSGVSTLKISYTLEPASARDDRVEDRPHDDVWGRIRSGFAIDAAGLNLISTHERWYTARSDYLARTVERARPFLHYIVEQVEARNMPTEIALLPVVESAFNPKAVSSARAAGIWQFIPGTARKYGLSLDQWYDGRRDVVEATRAALDYLEELHHLFGDWKLALAAYNCGEGCVQRAIARNRARGLSTAYEHLALPTETKHYVPKLMAIKHIVAEPRRFGITLDSIPNAPYFTQVTLAQPMDMRSAAHLAGLSVDELSGLNPGYHRNRIVYSDIPRQILLPTTHAEAFVQRLATGNGTVTVWKPLAGKKGEAVADIARRYAVSVDTLSKHNTLSLRKGKLRHAQTVLVPVKEPLKPDPGLLSSREISRPAAALASPANPVDRHIVQPGDTLYSLGKRYQVSVSDLRDRNGLAENDTLHPGQELDLVAPAPESLRTPVVENFYQTEYTVQPGDTLFSIARRFKVGVSELLLWNGMSESDKLKTGTHVVLYPPAS